ncbi:dihydroorotase [Bryocella elongata]|uniref:Dihydroorotase n=1 Tax=Bryocella elongata TaxID=863522 RepID=A0A1H5YGJ6_9BACT|nr:amidohydrolase family protein [Bryocella elongata]SEG23168.1 dihydroorotase [Bryocella elongata]
MLRVEGTIVNHDRVYNGAVEIDEVTGLIVNVGEATGHSDIDTKGCLIFPGFGDVHIHAREDSSGLESYKEDFTTVGQAALQGGVAHVADMPNNRIAPVDDARYEAKEALAAKCAVHVTLYAGIGPHTRPLTRHVPYKAFMGPSVGDLFFSSQEELERAIGFYRGKNVSFHCEDPVILNESKGEPTHEQRRPARAELTATEFALYLIEKYELQGKLCHYSVGQGLPKIAAAKARGLRVTCEVTPHHLFFDTTDLTDENRPWLQMNPPLRAPEDRTALIEALRNGLIDYIATDHAPHTHEENAKGISGVPHLDTYGAFAAWLIKEHHFTPEQIARVCAFNPGNFVREFLPADCGEGFGVIAPGYVGSLTLLDMETPWTVQREEVKTKCAWSPFEGFTFPGRVRSTVIRGKVHGVAS